MKPGYFEVLPTLSLSSSKTLHQSYFQLFVAVVAFFLGFGIYGCVALYGVCSVEAAPRHLTGTASAFVAVFANSKMERIITAHAAC